MIANNNFFPSIVKCLVIENFQLRYVYIIELSIIEELRGDRLNDIVNINYNREWLGIICWKLWILIMESTNKCHHSIINSISLEFCTAIILLSTRLCHQLHDSSSPNVFKYVWMQEYIHCRVAYSSPYCCTVIKFDMKTISKFY